MTTWVVTTREGEREVEADDQWGAFDSLRDVLPVELGIVVQAKPKGASDDDSYACRTSHLMGRWGKNAVARAFIALAVANGLPDTTAEDLIQSEEA